jgi:hypothetical protein
MNPELRKYLNHKIDNISGWLDPIDAEIIAALSTFQQDRNINGDMLEIGVHHGRLFFVLALSMNGSERALAVDLFEDDPNNSKKHRGRDLAFFKHVKALDISERVSSIKANTLKLSKDDIASNIKKARIISVDAGHLHDEVLNDLYLAKSALADNGVIVADDYFNYNWPGVTTAVNHFIENNPEFEPFLITNGKLYICRYPDVQTYKDFVSLLAHSRNVATRSVETKKFRFTSAKLSRRGALKHRVRAVVPFQLAGQQKRAMA